MVLFHFTFDNHFKNKKYEQGERATERLEGRLLVAALERVVVEPTRAHQSTGDREWAEERIDNNIVMMESEESEIRAAERSRSGGVRGKRRSAQFLDEVDVGEQHATATVPLQLQRLQGIAT